MKLLPTALEGLGVCLKEPTALEQCDAEFKIEDYLDKADLDEVFHGPISEDTNIKRTWDHHGGSHGDLILGRCPDILLDGNRDDKSSVPGLLHRHLDRLFSSGNDRFQPIPEPRSNGETPLILHGCSLITAPKYCFRTRPPSRTTCLWVIYELH